MQQTVKINWDALTTNYEIPDQIAGYPAPIIDDEDQDLLMPTDAYVPQKFVVTTPKMPKQLSRRERLEFNTKIDKIVNQANKCVHRYFWNVGRLNIPLKGVHLFEPKDFILFVEYIEEVNMEWAKQPSLDDWRQANLGRLPM